MSVPIRTLRADLKKIGDARAALLQAQRIFGGLINDLSSTSVALALQTSRLRIEDAGAAAERAEAVAEDALEVASKSRDLRLAKAPTRWISQSELQESLCLFSPTVPTGRSVADALGGYVEAKLGGLGCGDEVLIVDRSRAPWRGVVVRVNGGNKSVKVALDELL